MKARVRFSGVNEVLKGYELYEENFVYVCQMALSDAIQFAANLARRKAPWTDRTGNARNSLLASAQTTRATDGKIYGKFGINVYYGKYLEFKNNGKYAIIGPIVRSRIIEIRMRENIQSIGVHVRRVA